MKQLGARLVLSQGFLVSCRVSLSGQRWAAPQGREDRPGWRVCLVVLLGDRIAPAPVSSQRGTLGDSLSPLFLPLSTPFLAASLTVFHSPQYDSLGHVYGMVLLLFFAVKKPCLIFLFFASCYYEGPGRPSWCLLRMFRLRKQSKAGGFVQESWSWPHLSLQTRDTLVWEAVGVRAGYGTCPAGSSSAFDCCSACVCLSLWQRSLEE